MQCSLEREEDAEERRQLRGGSWEVRRRILPGPAVSRQRAAMSGPTAMRPWVLGWGQGGGWGREKCLA